MSSSDGKFDTTASSSSNDDATLVVEMRQRLMVAESVFLYKIPSLKTSGGHRYE